MTDENTVQWNEEAAPTQEVVNANGDIIARFDLSYELQEWLEGHPDAHTFTVREATREENPDE